MNPLIFGLFVVVAFNEIGIYGAAGMCTTFRKNTSGNVTTNASNIGTNNNFLEWFWQFLTPKPTTTPVPETTKPYSCSTCKCGLTNTQHRIIGGIETRINQYPWMAQLMYNGKFYCAASVINSHYVLTASHCVDRSGMDKIVVRIGDHDRSTNVEALTQDFKVDHIIKHGSYSTTNFDNDIALIKVRGIVRFKGLMRPVCLPKKGPTFAGEMGVVTGWGATQEGGSTSNKLLEVSLPIMKNMECRSMKYPEKRITDNMLCAGYPEGGKDSCQGDSGGPMHVINKTDKVHRVVGIVSWGEGCALPKYPGVYTRVNRYLTWIETHTADACYCN